MSKNCPIMQRMKDNYENRSKTYLTRKIPVIMRLDGKAFHTYTKGLVKPFDEGLIEDMQKTAIYLCENIQGAKAAYTQSDEISILITDYNKLTSEGWFNYNVQKMTSVSASYATGRFNQLRIIKKARETRKDILLDNILIHNDLGVLANFDSRTFSVPKDDVNNYFLARQRDAEKNSIAMLAQSLYSHKELHGKNGSDMQELCWQKGHNWNDLHFSKKRGSLIVKQYYADGILQPVPSNKNIDDVEKTIKDTSGKISWRTKWEVIETPIFSKSDIITDLI